MHSNDGVDAGCLPLLPDTGHSQPCSYALHAREGGKGVNIPNFSFLGVDGFLIVNQVVMIVSSLPDLHQ